MILNNILIIFFFYIRNQYEFKVFDDLASRYHAFMSSAAPLTVACVTWFFYPLHNRP